MGTIHNSIERVLPGRSSAHQQKRLLDARSALFNYTRTMAPGRVRSRVRDPSIVWWMATYLIFSTLEYGEIFYYVECGLEIKGMIEMGIV